MSKKKRVCTDILTNDCKTSRWGSILITLKDKDFDVITTKSGSAVSITHEKMKTYRVSGRLTFFRFDAFTIHAHSGERSYLNIDDCKKIRKAMIQLDLRHC